MAGSTEECPWERLERRLEHVETEVSRRKDHAHELELVVRTLAVQVDGMNGRMVDVAEGIEALTRKLEVHQEQEVERRVSEIQHRERETRANRRFQWTIGVSIVSVLVVLLQIYHQTAGAQ